jgi:hypothetical protein
MKKNFSLILFLFIFSISSLLKYSYANSEIIKNAALGTTIGLSTYFLTQATRKTFQEWTGTKTIFANCKTMLNLKNIPLCRLDGAYACAGGTYLTMLTGKDNNEQTTKNALRLWTLISLLKTTKSIKEFEIDSLIPILSAATSVSKIKSDSFSDSNSKKKEEDNPSQLKKAIKALPLQKYKRIYLSILFWSLWQLYKEKKICISLSQKNFFELCNAYKYGLIADLISDGSHKKIALEFLITHFLAKLETNSYQLGDFFKDFGIIEGLASTIQIFC